MNSIAPEPLKRFEPNFTKIFPIISWLGFHRRGFKGQSHRKHFPKNGQNGGGYPATVRRQLLSAVTV